MTRPLFVDSFPGDEENPGMDYIEDFLSYISKVRALSDNTVISYSTDLRAWKRYMGIRNLDPLSFTKEDAALYAEYLSDEFSER